MESAMIALLLVLVGVLTYILFSPTSIIGPWLDKYCQEEKELWKGEDIEPNYQEGTPYIKPSEQRWDDPEVPNRPTGKKK